MQVMTAAFLLAVLGILSAMAMGRLIQLGPLLVPLLASLAILLRAQENLRGFAFTAWVLAFVAASMVRPQTFSHWLGYDLKSLIVPLVQIIMFGMGTKLSGQDFVRVLVMPRPVLIGVALHFGVMPLTGYTIARTFGFPAEVAAGVVGQLLVVGVQVLVDAGFEGHGVEIKRALLCAGELSAYPGHGCVLSG